MKPETEIIKEGEFLFYQSAAGNTKIQVIVENETIWTTQKAMAELFEIERSVITKHLKNIFESKELEYNSTSAKIALVQNEGNRKVTRQVEFYNLDAIISVGYRVNSQRATQFRIWATSVLKEYLIKGFALDDERLKQGKQLFGKDYFDELLERIREIRASERLFYQKITDIFAQCSVDYDKNSDIAKEFYANVQNRLHWAIHQHTAAEILIKRANAEVQNMGLTNWKNQQKGGKILKSDVGVAKNYLSENELKNLNLLVTMFLDYAENLVNRHKIMEMKDWSEKLNDFLKFNEYDILQDFGKVKNEIAKTFAEEEYEKYKILQDKEYKSDFDKILTKLKEKN